MQEIHALLWSLVTCDRAVVFVQVSFLHLHQAVVSVWKDRSQCVGKFPHLHQAVVNVWKDGSQCVGRFPALASDSSQNVGACGKFPALDTVGTFCLQV